MRHKFKFLEKLRATFCAWFGHSSCVDSCFGYQHCARCGTMLGDSLAGSVRAGILSPYCKCKACQETIYKKLPWRDRFLVPKSHVEKWKGVDRFFVPKGTLKETDQ